MADPTLTDRVREALYDELMWAIYKHGTKARWVRMKAMLMERIAPILTAHEQQHAEALAAKDAEIAQLREQLAASEAPRG